MSEGSLAGDIEGLAVDRVQQVRGGQALARGRVLGRPTMSTLAPLVW